MQIIHGIPKPASPAHSRASRQMTRGSCPSASPLKKGARPFTERLTEQGRARIRSATPPAGDPVVEKFRQIDPDFRHR